MHREKGLNSPFFTNLNTAPLTQANLTLYFTKKVKYALYLRYTHIHAIFKRKAKLGPSELRVTIKLAIGGFAGGRKENVKKNSGATLPKFQIRILFLYQTEILKSLTRIIQVKIRDEIHSVYSSIVACCSKRSKNSSKTKNKISHFNVRYCRGLKMLRKFCANFAIFSDLDF